ncbi:MAG: hypothetical protein WAV90_05140 [Gordonia amarae]
MQSDPEWWKARGKTAEKAASDLRNLAFYVEPLQANNHYGDCTEGRSIHDMFRGVVTTWATDLKVQAESAQNLADACFAAAKTLADADHDAASIITPR